MIGEETTEEVIVVPPTVSEEAPSERHQGEPASPNQHRPVCGRMTVALAESNLFEWWCVNRLRDNGLLVVAETAAKSDRQCCGNRAG